MPARRARRIRIAFILATGGGLAGVPGRALADDPPQLDPVEVTGRHENAVGEWDAASQGVASGKEIAERALLRPGELLEAVPGMIVTQHSGTGKANQYFLRGYNLDHGTDFATWVAGMPVNMPTHAHGQGYTDLNFLIPELVARVQYRKGPYYAEDGDFSSVGSARIDYVDTLPRSLASLTGGSFNYWRALLAGSPAVGGGRLLYALEVQYDDGPWKTPEQLKRLNGVLRYSQGNAGNGFNVTAMAYSARWNSTDQIPRRAVDTGLIDRLGAIDPSDGGRSRRTSLSAEWRQSEDGVSRHASVYAIASRLDLWSNFTYFLDRPSEGDQFEQAEQRTVLGGSASQTWFRHWGERHVFTTVGLQVRRDRLAPVALHDSVARQRTDTVRTDAVTVESIAPYLSSTIEWTEWFRTIAGVRFDQQRFSVASNIAANSGRAGSSIPSPKLSLVFGPWEKTEYFVNWGYGFHSNDARGTTITLDPKTGQAVDRVDPLVRTKGFELGLRSQFAPGLNTSLALWHLTQASELLFVGDAGTTEPSRPSRRYGAEWVSTYMPLPWLTLDASIALTRARFSDDDPAGAFVPGAPQRVASAGLVVGSLGPWSGSLRWRYFGARPLTEDGSVQSQSTSLFNARVGYAVSPGVRLNLDVLNLFGRKADDISYYYTSRLAGEPAAGVNDVHFHPVEPRTLRLSVVFEQ